MPLLRDEAATRTPTRSLTSILVVYKVVLLLVLPCWGTALFGYLLAKAQPVSGTKGPSGTPKLLDMARMPKILADLGGSLALVTF